MGILQTLILPLLFGEQVLNIPSQFPAATIPTGYRFVDEHMHDAPTPTEWGLHGLERADVNQADIAPLMVLHFSFLNLFISS